MSRYRRISEKKKREYFRHLYRTYRDEMYYVAYSILQNSLDAEDIIHDTFLTILPKLDEMVKNPESMNWNFMLTILKHKAYNLYKWKQKFAGREFKSEMLEEVYEEEPSTKVVEIELQQFCDRILSQMNKTYSDILVMRYYHEMSVTEVALALEKSPDNVRHMESRARKKFKELLDKYRGREDRLVEEIERRMG